MIMDTKNKLYLVSTSKHKKAIFDQVHLNCHLIKNNFDEGKVVYKNNVYEFVKEKAFGKALLALNDVREGIIIGLDTIVLIDNKICEKPKTKEEAFDNIKKASLSSTKVITGIAIIDKYQNKNIIDYQESKVYFRKIDSFDIDYYFKKEANYMNAAGMVAETVLSNHIDRIDGSFYNVIGVPVEKIYNHLYELGYHLADFD